MSKPQDTYHVDKDGDIVDEFGGLVYDGDDLEPMSREAKERLADLHTQNPEWDWMKASAVLVEEGLIEPF